MARRFIEMQADAAAELDFSLGFFKGNALGEDVDDEMIDRAILGKSYAEYTAARDELYKKYQVRVGPEGRAVFYGDTMGTDVQPGEGISPETKKQHTLQTDDVSLVDFEYLLFGEE
ncbi:hypothetical protein, partial [Eudoraea sp.]|uniref:hypothetical protein n=1 Tax=Eudoraea sp. TaxID=1979955 RepID=UPI003C72B222